MSFWVAVVTDITLIILKENVYSTVTQHSTFTKMMIQCNASLSVHLDSSVFIRILQPNTAVLIVRMDGLQTTPHGLVYSNALLHPHIMLIWTLKHVLINAEKNCHFLLMILAEYAWLNVLQRILLIISLVVVFLTVFLNRVHMSL